MFASFGERFLPADHPDLEKLAAVFFGADGPPERPAGLVRPRTVDEVAEVVRTVRDRDLPLVVRSGGHSYSRASVADGALVLDLRLLNDVDATTGHAAGGATAGRFARAAGPLGLATGFGDTADVGIAGLVLGGGIGHLSRRDGLTIDNVTGAEVVLADGSVVRADARHEPDLFWALRGGGGGLGVITALVLKTTPTPTVTGGLFAFPPAADTLIRLVEAVREAPDGLSAMVNVMRAPPLPFLPADRHGTPMIGVAVCWSGDPDGADAALAPLRAAGRPWLDQVRTGTYPDLIEGAPPFAAGNLAETRTGFLDTVTTVTTVTTAWAATAVERIEHAVTPAAVVNLRVMGGAIARVPVADTAFAHRDRAVMATVSAMTPDPDRAAAMREWTADAGAALSLGGGYVNFITGDLGSAYPPATLDRLRRIRAEYDPSGLFRHDDG